MSIQELQLEYEREGIGEGILGILDGLVRNVARSYDPRVYGGAASWAEAHDDLLHSFVVDVLLEQGQLEYALFVAGSVEHFKNILGRQLRFFLARGRRRTVVDNLLDRCKEITAKAPFQQAAEKRAWSYALEDQAPGDRRATPDLLAQVAGELAGIPVQEPSVSERASQVYLTPDLIELLRRVASSLECWVSARDLDDLFRQMLTPWLPSFLGTDEGALAIQPAKALSAEQEDMARQAAEAICGAGSATELKVLGMKIGDVSDSVIGRRLGVSRPTVIKHKKRILGKVEAELTGLDEASQSRAIELLASLIQEGQDAT